MGTIQVTTQAAPLTYPSLPSLVRDHTNGYQYCILKDTAGNFDICDSTNAGATWTVLASFTRANVIEWSGLVADRNDYIHFCYRVNESSLDKIYYRRVNLTTGAFSTELLLSSNANGGVAGAVWQGLDLGVVRHSNGTYAIIVAGAFTQGTTQHGLIVSGVSIGSDGLPYLNHPIISNRRDWFIPGTAPGRATPTVELEHNGDGFTSSTPHAWISWGRTTIYMVKVTWLGSSVGWQGPNTYQTIKSGVPAQDYLSARWDGSRFLIASINPAATSTVIVYERNQANTTTTERVTPVHPTGVIRQIAISYNNTTGGIRVFAVGTSTTVLYYIDYSRTGGTWGTWTQVSATAILGATGGQFGVRRGGTYGNAKYDVYTAHATPSPNTVLSAQMLITSAPSTPTWDTSTQPYTNGGAADVAASLTLDWTFSDPDPTDTQGSYAISRQIGAGALAYWRASDSTWQVTEQQNASGTSALTLASSWALASDAAYTYKVKVWDSGGSASGYSSGLILIPSAKANPTITSPTAAQVLGVNSVTVTWTVSEQTAYRLVLKQTSPTASTVYDSGYVTSSAMSVTVPVTLANTTGWTVELTTKNLEGLASTTQTRSFTVSYTVPATPTLVVLPITASGIIRVTTTNPAPGGGQPALLSQDLYRRVVGTTTNGTRIANGLVSGAVFDDWGAAARTAYEYRMTAFGVNGTQVQSVWTA